MQQLVNTTGARNASAINQSQRHSTMVAKHINKTPTRVRTCTKQSIGCTNASPPFVHSQLHCHNLVEVSPYICSQCTKGRSTLSSHSRLLPTFHLQQQKPGSACNCWAYTPCVVHGVNDIMARCLLNHHPALLLSFELHLTAAAKVIAGHPTMHAALVPQRNAEQTGSNIAAAAAAVLLYNTLTPYNLGSQLQDTFKHPLLPAEAQRVLQHLPQRRQCICRLHAAGCTGTTASYCSGAATCSGPAHRPAPAAAPPVRRGATPRCRG